MWRGDTQGQWAICVGLEPESLGSAFAKTEQFAGHTSRRIVLDHAVVQLGSTHGAARLKHQDDGTETLDVQKLNAAWDRLLLRRQQIRRCRRGNGQREQQGAGPKAWHGGKARHKTTAARPRGTAPPRFAKCGRQ